MLELVEVRKRGETETSRNKPLASPSVSGSTDDWAENKAGHAISK
jgi:hypothetical protein